MNSLEKILGKLVIVGDGAMGSLLTQSLSGKMVPDELNLTRPDLIERIHCDYAGSGADFITTNTLGASALRLKEVGLEKHMNRINHAAVKLARKAAQRSGIWVAGDIGPSGKLIAPLGELTFAEAVKNFARQARILEKAGVDLIVIETMIDIQEFRAAVIGTLGTVKIPVFASASFGADDRTPTGTGAEAFAVTGSFPGLAAIGANCGTTVTKMITVVSQIARYSPLPILARPNAGLPRLIHSSPTYDLKPKEFAEAMVEIYKRGAAILGSCCGSTPEFTQQLANRFKRRPVLKREVDNRVVLSSRTQIRSVDRDKIFLVGERINPSGRKKLADDLISGNLSLLKSEAKGQELAGCDSLDVNLNVHGLDLSRTAKLVQVLQDRVSIPLFIDSTDPEVIETFACHYAGKGAINSISAEEGTLKSLLPLAKKYNLAVVASLLDQRGIPATARARLSLAKKVVKLAKKIKLPIKDILFDPLVLSAGAEVEKSPVTIETIRLLRKEYPQNPIIIGLSNISHGLPRREQINAAFLTLTFTAGLNMVIANPLDENLLTQIKALRFLLTGDKKERALFISRFSEVKKEITTSLQTAGDNLHANIVDGDGEKALKNVEALLPILSPLEIIETIVSPAMDEVGRNFQEKIFFLPQLMAAADAVKAVLPLLKEKLPKKDLRLAKKILFATVQGDIHDIGKNIVIGVLESFNFNVTDLGKDISPEIIVAKALEEKVDIIALSTLMTTTIPVMLSTIEKIRKIPELKNIPIFIGGAVITDRMAKEFGVLYGRDGMAMVDRLRRFPESGERS